MTDEKDGGPVSMAPAEIRASTAWNTRPREAELVVLLSDLLDVWDPEWEPGKTLHERAVALIAKARGES